MYQEILYRYLREAFVYLEYEDMRLLAPFDLDPVEYSALHLLGTGDGLRMSDLRDRLLADKSKVTRVVDHFEARGWARRVADPDDRRAARVELTQDGVAHRDLVTGARSAALPDRFSCLTDPEQAELAQFLDQLRQHLANRLQKPPEAQP